MRRREFIAGLGSAAAWPVAARAQQGERKRRIGVLMPTSEADAERQAQLKVFLSSLAVLGWTEGRNVTFEYRWTGPSGDLARASAKELVVQAPDLILTQSVEMVTALRHETRTIPILFAGASDPVELGLVDSLARPGGNVTGFTGLQAATTVKFLELIKRLDPRVTRALILMSSRDPSNERRSRAIEAGGPSLNVEVSKAEVSTASDIERAVREFAGNPGGALVVLPNPVTNTYRDIIIGAAANHRLPAIYQFREFATAGGLAAYGADQSDQFRRAASYADRILKGEQAGDLPVQAPVKLDLVINLKTDPVAAAMHTLLPSWSKAVVGGTQAGTSGSPQ
jgi:putative ABC transport system substrate-binding protein